MTQPEPTYHVLLVGIDAYNPKPLAGCVNDIDAVQRLLIERARIPPASIRRLASPRPDARCETSVPALPATLANLRAALGQLAAQVGPDDRFLLYYSGHGARVPVSLPDGHVIYREALVPVDVSETSERRLLFDHELNERLAAIRGSVTCIFDCCHSSGVARIEPLPGAPAEELPGARARSLDVAQDLGWRAPLPASDLGAARGAAAARAGAPRDCHIVAACLAHEQAIEATGEDGVQHGLLTASLLRALAPISDDELRTVPWSRIWEAMRASVEQRIARQHLWMTGNPRRAVIAGPPAHGDPGLTIRRDGDAYELDAGTLAQVTVSALVAVYGERTVYFPALGSDEDRAARRGLLRVTSASPARAAAVVEGGPFELPPGARGRIVEPGAAPRLRCAIVPRHEELAAALAASPLLELVDDARRAQVRLEQAGGRWLLADDVHEAHPARALHAIGPGELAHARAVLEHYYRYALPLRMAESARDLPGALRLTVLACDRELSAEAAQAAAGLSEAPTAADSTYDLTSGTLVCFRVHNTSQTLLRVTLLNAAASGRVQILGDQVIDPHAAFVFWLHGVLGSPFEMAVPDDRQQGIDRFIAIGTTALGKHLGHLGVEQSFEDLRAVTPKDVRDPRSGVPADRWTAAQIIVKTRA
jgi:hypothetical protein